jgi:hypothetical protein
MMRRAFAFVALPLLLAGVGCSRGPERAPLSGKVSIDGVPIRFGAVVVTSQDETVSTSGAIADDGTFLVPDAPVGPVLISVSVPDRPNAMLPSGGKVTPKMSEQLAKQAPQTGEMPPELATAAASVPPIPSAYQFPKSSGLTTTVAKEGSTYDVKMTSAPAAGGAGGGQPRPPGLPPNMPWPPK